MKKISLLSMNEIDYVIAKILKLQIAREDDRIFVIDNDRKILWSPTQKWSQCGPLLDCYRIDLDRINTYGGNFRACQCNAGNYHSQYGQTAREAICKCFISLKLDSDTIDDRYTVIPTQNGSY